MGECTSNAIILREVEIKLVDFRGTVVPFYKNFEGRKKFNLKIPEWGEVGTSPKKWLR